MEAMSKETALFLLEEIRDYLCKGNPVWDVTDVADALDMAIDALKANKPQWIPVSERLPEHADLVLVSLTGQYGNIDFESGFAIAEYYGDEGWLIEEYPDMDVRTCAELIEAWRELPEPYKGGDNG